MASLREIILSHAKAPYDPVARRERYLRDRKLIGRTPGGQAPMPGSRMATQTPGGQVHFPGQPNKPMPNTPVTPQRVAAMQARLETLKNLLAKLTAQANAKAGAAPPQKAASTTQKTAQSTKQAKPKTPAEKQAAAKKEKAARAADPKSSDTVNSLQAQIDTVHTQIAQMRATLAAAKKAAASKPKAPPAPKPSPGTKLIPPADKKPPVRKPTAN